MNTKMHDYDKSEGKQTEKIEIISFGLPNPKELIIK